MSKNCIIQYKDEGKTLWQDYKVYTEDEIINALDKLKYLDKTKYRIVLRSETVISPKPKSLINTISLTELKERLDNIKRYSYCIGNVEVDIPGGWFKVNDLYDLIDSLKGKV